MRTLIVVSLALVSCSKKLETKRTERLDFKGFTVPVPAGWNEVTDSRITGQTPAGGHVVMMVDAPKGFAPSIYIQELELGPNDHQQLVGATMDTCRDVMGKQMVEMTHTSLGTVRVANFNGLKGCDIDLADQKTEQAARQISISNGKLAVSLTCNHDKKGEPVVDSACVAIASNITAK